MNYVKNQIFTLQENSTVQKAAYFDVINSCLSIVSLKHNNSATISVIIKWSSIPISWTNVTIKFSQSQNMHTCFVQFMECEKGT